LDQTEQVRKGPSKTFFVVHFLLLLGRVELLLRTRRHVVD